jgi:tetraacyldisaccharide 4'-kinase
VSRGIVPPQTSDACFAFCGVARPQNFFAELRAAGIHLAGTHEFRDHHAYSAADIQSLLRLRQQSGATALVTTEKDAVNLGTHLFELEPIHVVPVRMQFENAIAGGAVTNGVTASPVDQFCGLIGRLNQGRVRE